MRRYFHSPHPTFGSYRNPTHWKIEASPYFWWWYALTLNRGYVRLCEQSAAERARRETDGRMLKVHEDFGDVRYNGCRYLAFTQWWTERVNTSEQRGAYLFAEPLRKAAVSVVHSEDEAAAALSSEHTLLLAVDLQSQRKYIDGWVDRLLQRHMGELKRGRQVRNPKLSAARYRLSKAVQAHALKKIFTVYDVRRSAETDGRRVSNWEVAQLAKLDYRQRERADEAALEGADERRVVSAIVARHVKHANAMIESASVGTFP